MRDFQSLVTVCLLVLGSIFYCDGRCHGGDGPVVVGMGSYVVEVTEFQIKSAADPKLTSDRILDAFNERKRGKESEIEMLDTTRINVIDGESAKVSVTNESPIVIKANKEGGKSGKPPVAFREIGTTLEVTATPHEDKIRLKLRYRSSRQPAKKARDRSDSHDVYEVDSTILLEPGVPVFLGGSSREPGNHLVVSIEREKSR